MSIPLPDMLRALRIDQFEQQLTPPRVRLGLAAWAFLARRPRLYQWVTAAAIRALGALGRKRGRFRRLPLAGGWTRARDLPVPAGHTFQMQWRRARKGRR